VRATLQQVRERAPVVGHRSTNSNLGNGDLKLAVRAERRSPGAVPKVAVVDAASDGLAQHVRALIPFQPAEAVGQNRGGHPERVADVRQRRSFIGKPVIDSPGPRVRAYQD
jgi:hypothetical protein